MTNLGFMDLPHDQLARVSGGASPFLEQLWASANAKRWNAAYGNTIDSAAFHGVPSWQRNSLAVEHADYITGRSRFPAAAVPYVTVGPGAVR